MKTLFKDLVKEYITNTEFKFCVLIGLFVLTLVLGLKYFV